MRALVLAGGRGKRLGRLTDSIPKPLVSLGDTTPLDFVLAQLIDAGAKECYVSVGYLADRVEAHVAHAGYDRLGVRCLRDPDGVPLGTAGPVGLVPDRSGTLVVVNTDIFCPQLDISDMTAVHSAREAAMTIGFRTEANRIPYGVLDIADGGDVVGVEEKPVHRVPVAGGIYVLELGLLGKVIPAHPEPLAMPDLIQRCLDADLRCGAYELPSPWIDLGTPERLAEATAYLLSRSGGSSR